MTGLIKLRDEIEKLDASRGKLKATGNAKPSSTKATSAGDPPAHVYVELDKPSLINGRPSTALPHMPLNYRY
jgi:hypothetical protein